jgi:tetratricopeptide (TPR) repeat protein
VRSGAGSALLGAALVLLGCAKTEPPPVVATLPPLPYSASSSTPLPHGPDVSEEIARAESALAADNPVDARLATEEALAKDPTNAKALYYSAVSLEKLGLLREAEGRYKKALASDPTFPEAAINLGAMYIDADRGAEAMEVLRPVARAWPADAMLQENLGLAAHLIGEHETVIACFAKLEKQGALREETRLAYVDALLATNRKDDAKRVILVALAAPSSDPLVLVPFTTQLAAVGMVDDAIRLLSTVIAKSPTAELLTRRAIFLRLKKDVPGSRADVERAITLDEGFAGAHLFLADILEAEKSPKAHKEYERAAELAKDDLNLRRAKDGMARTSGTQK